MKNALLAGWFSFEDMGASAGDLMARDLAWEWLGKAGYNVDVALAPPFEGGVDWRTVEPRAYTKIVFVCGPFGNGWPLVDFLEKFKEIEMCGLNCSMLEPLETFNPFAFLLERDSDRASRPDIAFLSSKPSVPVVGKILIDNQPEYGEQAQHTRVHALIDQFLKNRDVAVIAIDTRLDHNKFDLRTPQQIETVIARTDVVITTRLHGTVLALKNGIPTIAIDSVAGGAKLLTQANAVKWPIVFVAEELSQERLHEAFQYCLTDQARVAAKACGENAKAEVDRMRDSFVSTMTEDHPWPE